MTDAVTEPGVGDAPNLVPPPGNPRFPLFDSLRALAALSVFAGHTVTGVYTLSDHPTRFLWAVDLAYEGVAIFFLISGFLLYRPFLAARRGGRPVRLGSYATRRVLRIVPAYWVALTIFIAAGFVSGVTTNNWWIFYGFGQIYSGGNIGNGIGVAWTLCIEVTFYAALPVFALACARLGASRFRADVVLLVLLAAGSLVFRAHFSAFIQVARVSTLAGTFFWFALGMGLAICSVWLQERAPRLGGSAAVHQLWPVASWTAAIGLLVLNHQVQTGFLGLDARGAVVLTHVLYGLSALFVLLPAVFAERRAGPVQSVLRLRLLAWIGLVSYAFYLYHTIVIDQLNKLAKDAGISARYAFVAVTSLVLTLVCASASYYLLERPVMRWGRASERRRRARAGAAPAPKA